MQWHRHLWPGIFLDILRGLFDEIQSLLVAFLSSSAQAMNPCWPIIMAFAVLFFRQMACMARPSSKPGRIHGTYAISPPKISLVSFSQFLLAAMEMIGVRVHVIHMLAPE